MANEARKVYDALDLNMVSAGDRDKASVGGIDFDGTYLQMNLRGNGSNMIVPQEFEWLLRAPVQGFSPRILEIHSGLGHTLSFFNGLLNTE